MDTKLAEYEYLYLGDRQTDPHRKKARCCSIRNAQGKCIRGRNGNFLVRFEDGTAVVVLGRLLRKGI